jgi:NitT/TauT family transport system substrate-binding protein/putative hydroxymethylpyrimidine transport system substrate-binding protein
MRRARITLLPCLLALALAVAACGGDGDDRASSTPPPTVDLALDFTPNAVHAPIFAAVADGADRAQGIHLRVRNPGDTPDSLKLVAGGRALVGILDIHDLAVARARGVDVVGIGALVQRPLAALLAHPSIRRPRDLNGKTVGVSGLPSDPAFLKAIVEKDGGDYDSIRQVTIGFKAVPALLARRVDAVPAFWNAEGVALKERGVRIRQLRVEDYGAPAYPEVVLIAMRKSVEERPAQLRAAVRTIARGVQAVQDRPDEAVRLVAERAGTNDRALIRAQLDAVLPLFSPPVRLDRDVLERWADFDARIGIVDERPDVDRAFAFDLAR